MLRSCLRIAQHKVWALKCLTPIAQIRSIQTLNNVLARAPIFQNVRYLSGASDSQNSPPGNAPNPEKEQRIRAADRQYPFQDEMEIDSVERPRLIGKGGQTVRRLGDETGTYILVPKDTQGDKANITIRGPSREAIEQAKLKIREHLGNLPKELSSTLVTVDRQRLGFVLGRGWEKLRRVATETGTFITLKPGDADPATFEVKGPTAEAVNAAKEKLLSEAAEATSRPKAPTKDAEGDVQVARLVPAAAAGQAASGLEETIDVEERKVGFLVGRGGSNLQRMTEETGATAQFMTGQAWNDPLTGSRMVRLRIRGPTAEAVHKAKQFLTKDSGKFDMYQALESGGVEEVVEVEDDVMKHVIGRGGSNLKRMTEITGATATRLDNEGAAGGMRRLRLRGPDAGSIRKAKEFIAQETSKNASRSAPAAVRDEVNIARAAVYMVVGPSGTTVDSIERRSGARVKIDKADRAGSGKGEAVVVLEGPTQEAVAAAKRLVLEAVSKAAARADEPQTAPEAEEVLRVGDVEAGWIIGKEGRRLRQIIEESGAQIVVEPRPAMDGRSDPAASPSLRVVRIRSKDAASVAKAKSMVAAICEEAGLPLRDQPLTVVREVLEVPSAHTGRIMGPGGSWVMAMQRNSGASIFIERKPPAAIAAQDASSTTKVTLEGPTQATVDAARRAVLNAVAESEAASAAAAAVSSADISGGGRFRTQGGQVFQEVVMIEAKVSGRVIGKGGQTVRKIMQDTDTHISVEPESAEPAPSATAAAGDAGAAAVAGSGQWAVPAGHRPVVIRAQTEEALKQAKERILSIVAAEPSVQSFASDEREVFTVSSQHIPKLIGKGGMTIKSLMAETGASITIENRSGDLEDQDQERNVTVRGKAESIMRVRDRIDALVAESAQRKGGRRGRGGRGGRRGDVESSGRGRVNAANITTLDELDLDMTEYDEDPRGGEEEDANEGSEVLGELLDDVKPYYHMQRYEPKPRKNPPPPPPEDPSAEVLVTMEDVLEAFKKEKYEVLPATVDKVSGMCEVLRLNPGMSVDQKKLILMRMVRDLQRPLPNYLSHFQTE